MSDDLIPHLRIKFTWFLGILAVFVIFVVIGKYSAHMAQVYPGYDQQRAEERMENLKKVREAETKLITTVAWVDQGKKIISIPIDEAMAKEIETLKTKPVEMCATIIPGSVPAPPPATTPAPATTNAAPSVPAAPAPEKK
jgi:hypothetical protein